MLQDKIKKGQLGTLKNGWRFRIEDNAKGIVRLATVYGLFTEMGSIYLSDIATLDMPNGTTEPLQQTPKQAAKSKHAANLMKSIFGA